jgi:hypothetical protein
LCVVKTTQEPQNKSGSLADKSNQLHRFVPLPPSLIVKKETTVFRKYSIPYFQGYFNEEINCPVRKVKQ